MSPPITQSPATTRPPAPVARAAPTTVQYNAGATVPVLTVPVWVQYGGPYFTGGAAVVAAVLATMVALRGIKAGRDNVLDQIIAQRQIAARTARASVVSANRQKWIDGLRDDLAEFLAADFELLDNYNAAEKELDEGELSENKKRVAEARRVRRVTQRRIQLRLNPNKLNHQELYQAVRKVMPATGEAHREARVRMVKVAQALLRQEWLRLKAEAGDWGEAQQPSLQ